MKMFLLLLCFGLFCFCSKIKMNSTWTCYYEQCNMFQTMVHFNHVQITMENDLFSLLFSCFSRPLDCSGHFWFSWFFLFNFSFSGTKTIIIFMIFFMVVIWPNKFNEFSQSATLNTDKTIINRVSRNNSISRDDKNNLSDKLSQLV